MGAADPRVETDAPSPPVEWLPCTRCDGGFIGGVECPDCDGAGGVFDGETP